MKSQVREKRWDRAERAGSWMMPNTSKCIMTLDLFFRPSLPFLSWSWPLSGALAGCGCWMVLPSAGLLSGCPPLLASDGSLPGKAASGRGEDPREAVPAQLHGQTQRPSLHVGRQRFYQTSPSTWYSSYSMGRDSRGKGSVRFKLFSPSPGPPDAPTPVFCTLLTPRALDQGPGGLPAAWTLIPPSLQAFAQATPPRPFPTCLTRWNVTGSWRPISKASSACCFPLIPFRSTKSNMTEAT